MIMCSIMCWTMILSVSVKSQSGGAFTKEGGLGWGDSQVQQCILRISLTQNNLIDHKAQGEPYHKPKHYI